MNLKNYKIAAIIMVLMMIVAIFIGGSKAIVTKSNKVEIIYNDQLKPELERQAEKANELIVLAQLEKMDDGLINKLNQDVTAFNEASNKTDKYIAFMQLQNSFTALKMTMVEQMSTTEHERSLNSIYQNFYSAFDLISRSKDNYNQEAKKYNESLDSFPLSIIKLCLGKGKADLFA